MACPFFEPGSRLEEPFAPGLPPLGDWHTGTCRSPRPGVVPYLEFCHYGYARGRCVHFPPSSHAPDAVRFAIAFRPGRPPEVRFALEKDHYPAGHGAYPAPLSSGEAESVLQKQASAYWNAYQRRQVRPR